MNRIVLICFAIVLTGMMACKSKKPVTDTAEMNDTPISGTPVEMRSLASGPYCGINEVMNKLITTEAEWKEVWKVFGSNRMPAPDRPQVNFDEQYVIACVMGTRNSGGHSAKVTAVSQSGSELHVAVKYTSPGKGCFTTDALTQPFEFVLVPSKDVSSAKFNVSEVTEDCEK